MCKQVKVIPDRLRDIVGVRDTAIRHLLTLCRPRRRALWSELASLLRHGLLAARARLQPNVQIATDGAVKLFGALHNAGCVTVLGIVGRKMTLYAVIDRTRLLRRAGEDSYCTIIDEGDRLTRVCVMVAQYRYIVWAASRDIIFGLEGRRSQYLMEILPSETEMRATA